MLKQKRIQNFIFLHISIFIFALSGVANKMSSGFLAEKGIFSKEFIFYFGLYGILTIIYAVSWQISLEKYKLSFLYMNRSFYMVWTQLFAVLIFKNEIYFCNIVGLLLIIMGVWVNSKDA